jgi:hypothetical protein
MVDRLSELKKGAVEITPDDVAIDVEPEGTGISYANASVTNPESSI